MSEEGAAGAVRSVPKARGVSTEEALRIADDLIGAMDDYEAAMALRSLAAERDVLLNGMELAWTIIANASGGDWDKERADWKDAAERWRDRFMPLTSALLAARALTPPTRGAQMTRDTREPVSESDEDLLLSLETYTLNAAEYPDLRPRIEALRAQILARMKGGASPEEPR